MMVVDNHTIGLDYDDEVNCYLCDADIRESKHYMSVTLNRNGPCTGTASFFICNNCLKNLATEAVQKRWYSIYERREQITGGDFE